MKKVCSILATVLMIVLLIWAAVLIVPKLIGMEEYAVLTASMEPEIPVGSLVFDKKPDMGTLKVGDVVTYQISGTTLVTHRVTAINDADKTIITKGDANDVEDGAPVEYSNVLGVCAFHLPYLGYISLYSKTPLGISGLCGLIVIVILLNFLPDLFGKSKDDKKSSK